MQEAVPAGQGAMVVVLGLEDADVVAACAGAAQGEVVEAVNFNAPGQVVIAGHAARSASGDRSLQAKGAKRALELPVSVPSHSSLMRPAAEKLRERLENVEVRRPRFRRSTPSMCASTASRTRFAQALVQPAVQPGALGRHGAADDRRGRHPHRGMRSGKGAHRAQPPHRAPQGDRDVRAGRQCGHRRGDRELSGDIECLKDNWHWSREPRAVSVAPSRLGLGGQGATVIGTATTPQGAEAIAAALTRGRVQGQGRGAQRHR